MQQELMTFHQVDFIAGAARIDQIPNQEHLKEFAFIGRSNVGKSSLINSVLVRRAIARVSQNPGCTKQINFFQVENKAIIVDLPGYGFAKISNQERRLWDDLIHHYLSTRKVLSRVFILLDSRHNVKDTDIQAMKMLDNYAVPYQIVMTKVDKIADTSKIKNEVEMIARSHIGCHPVIIWSSSKEKTGILDIQNTIFS